MTTRDKMSTVPTPKQPTPKQLVAHVKDERSRRGWRSVRQAADHTAGTRNKISNQTWSTFEATGHVTPSVRAGIAEAFRWPLNWPEELPALSSWNSGAAHDEILRRLTEVEQQLSVLRRAEPDQPDHP